MIKKSFILFSFFELYNTLNKLGTAGLVMFTSGTSGIPKAAVHDLPKLLEKFINSLKEKV